MALSAGTAFVDVQPQIGAGFQGAIASKLGPIGTAGGLVLGAGIAAGVGGAVALGSIGDSFDQAFDTIRIGTGAVGEDLEGLQSTFKDVFAAVPTDIGSAATAIADLNTRTGLTGDALGDLATTTLELARINEEDLGTVIEKSTRLFGDWGLNIETQGVGAMNELFRASQATGVPVSNLSDLLVRYGAPLRQFGFEMSEGAAILGSFEKEGVNTELVMGSLRIALGKFAKEGKEPREALLGVFDAIQSTGSAAEANALAIETFGARAGPDMAAAIREGRFEIADLLGQIEEGSDTIQGAAADTESLGEKWTRFKNRVLVGIEPLASKFVDTLGRLFDVILPAVEPVIEGITTALGSIGSLFDGITGSAEDAEGTLGPIFQGLGETVGTFGNAFSTVFGIVRDVFEAVTGALGDKSAEIGGIFSTLAEIVRTIFEGLARFWNTWGDTITTILGTAIGTVVDVLGAAFEIIQGLFDVVLGILTGDWSRAWDGIKSVLSGAVDGILAILRGGLSIVTTLFTDTLGNVLGAVGGWITDMLAAVGGFGADLLASIGGFIADIPGMFVQLGVDIVGGILEGLGGLFGALKDKLIGGIGDALGAVGRFFGIGSPSRVFAEELGMPLGQGVALGIAQTTPETTAALTDSITEAGRTARPVLEAELANLAAPALGGSFAADLAGAAAQLGAAGAGIGGTIINLEAGAIVVQNPIPEEASTSVPRELRRLATTFTR